MATVEEASEALNRLAKWRTILAGRMFGTRPKGDPQSEAAIDLYEKLLLLRVEVTVAVRVIREGSGIPDSVWYGYLVEEAAHLEAMYEVAWPGIHATDHGMTIELPEGAETLRRKSQP